MSAASVKALSFPPESEEDLKRRVLSGNFQITLQRIDTRTSTQVSLQMTGPVYSDDGKEDPHELDKRVDRYQAVINRQLVLADIETWQNLIEGQLVNLDLMEKQKQSLDQKVESGAKLPSQQKEQLKQYESRRDQSLDQIKLLQAQIDQAKKKIGVE